MKINKIQLLIGAVFLVVLFPILSSAKMTDYDVKTEDVAETMHEDESEDYVTPAQTDDDMMDSSTPTMTKEKEDTMMNEDVNDDMGQEMNDDTKEDMKQEMDGTDEDMHEEVGEDDANDMNDDTADTFPGQRALDRMEKGFDRTKSAMEHMSDVAEKLHELLNINPGEGQDTVPEDGNELGNGSMSGKDLAAQIQEVAKAQEKAQEKIEKSFERVEKRSGLIKFLVGPDKDALNSLKEEIKANQERVKKLQEIQTQVQNESDQQMIQETVMSILNENIALQERVAEEEQGFSIIGFLLSLFS